MKYPIHLSEDDAKQLEFEIISDDLLIHLTRKLEKWAEEPDDSDLVLFRKNRLINMSRILSGEKVYVLEVDDMGDYWPQEHIWHEGDFKLIFRRLSTVEFAEFVCDLIEQKLLDIDEVNYLLDKDGVSFCFKVSSHDDITIQVLPIEDIDNAKENVGEHSNIRLLAHRMETSLVADDYPAVLHASASIFETLAKDIVGIPTVQDQTLKSFFDRYRLDSSLPDEILGYILNIYEFRNVTPLAGHGSTETPTITKAQAVILVELTKAFVRSEYKLRVMS